MNNFDGQLNLYPEICIDNFSSNVLFDASIRCFILTHFHDDHMNNLQDVKFYKLLKDVSRSVKFYCSPITRSFIETCEKYQHLTDLCNQVVCESPFLVKISHTENVTVTFCGSGHCPGSVMVFLEGSRGNVLFTGDFRLPLNCASRLVFFKPYNSNESSSNQPIQYLVKDCNDLYVDMTFFKPEIKSIPTREESATLYESVRALIKFINEFLKNSTEGEPKRKVDNSNNLVFKNYIYLKTSARIGYEYVYQEIFKQTGHKIHVNDLIYKIYDQLPVIQATLTKDPYETPIHCCIYENKKRDVAKSDLMKPSLPCNSSKSKKCSMTPSTSCSSLVTYNRSRPIIPCQINKENESAYDKTKVNCAKVILSAMWFTDTAGVEKIFVKYKPPLNEIDLPAYKPYNSIYRLCFSFHSSFEEIVDFVNTIKPKRLHSIALPESATDKTINDYFYSSNGKFQGFHFSSSSLSLSTNTRGGEASKYKIESVNLSDIKPLVLRKRKIVDKSVHKIGNNDDDGDDDEKENSSNDSSQSGDLNFGTTSSSNSEDEFFKSKKIIKK